MDVFLELSCFFDDPVDDGNLISGSSAFSKPSLSTWKFTVHVLLNVTIYSAHIYDQFRSQAETRRVRAVFRGFLAQRSVLCSISCVEEPAAGSDLPWRVSWVPQRALIPQGTWAPGSREAGSPQGSEEIWASFLLSSAETALMHPKAVGSNISDWGAGNPHKWSVPFEEADGKLSSRESNFNYRCKFKLFSLVLLMKK